MAVTPVVICLNASGEPLAHKVAALLGAQVHGREGRVEKADAFFPNALDHVRMLFAAGTPIVGVCAAGILIRAVAPILANKLAEPPVVAVADDGSARAAVAGWSPWGQPSGQPNCRRHWRNCCRHHRW